MTDLRDLRSEHSPELVFDELFSNVPDCVPKSFPTHWDFRFIHL